MGAVVRATFKGNVEHYLRERHLRHGLLALVLVPRGGQARGVIDEGSARSERVLRMTPARPAGDSARLTGLPRDDWRTKLAPRDTGFAWGYPPRAS